MSVLETSNFGNDEATDWLYDLEETYGAELLAEAFDTITKGEFHEQADCCIALAAAEIVAAAKGKPAPDLPEDARKWLGNQGHGGREQDQDPAKEGDYCREENPGAL